MRILELYLKAYGPFTERRVELGEGDPGLQVVFGRNEAGKSSALRAIHHLLYGIPARSTDDFVHDYRSMRIGGRLRQEGGRELAFLRKKGSKSTLRSWDDAEALPDAALEPFLRGVPEELFRRFFGIDHATLVGGSQSLLEDEGDVGRSLFAAGLGSGNLRKVISGLDDEARALFAPRATKNARINAGLSELKEIRSAIKTNSLKPRAWQDHQRELSRAEAELHGIESALAERRREVARLERIGAALPNLARRRQLLVAIEEMGAPTPLEDGFEERLHAALQTSRDATRELRRAGEALAQLRERLKGLVLDPAILEQREAIESLRERFGSYKAEREQLPRREGERERLDKELAADLAAIGARQDADQLDELRAPLRRRRQIEELADEHGRLQTLVESAGKSLRLGSQKQDGLRGQLASLPAARDAAGLRRALAAARALGDVDAQLRALALRCEAAQRAREDELAALGLWSDGLDALARAPVPSMETVERLQAAFDGCRSERERFEQRMAGARSEIGEIEARLEALRRAGAVPSEAELAAERERRDASWRLVRRRWIEGQPIDEEIDDFTKGEPLPAHYERSVAAADELADRLRRDAKRVAAQAELEAAGARAERSLEEVRGELSRVDEHESGLTEQWRGLWKALGIEPDPPREMLAWLRRQQKLVASVADGRSLQDERRALARSRAVAREGLLSELRSLDESVTDAGEELAQVVLRAEQAAQAIEAVEQKRSELEAAFAEAEASLAEAGIEERAAREALSHWSEAWSAAVEGLELAEGARPSEARDRLHAIAELVQRRQTIADLDTRIAAMRRDVDELERDLADFVDAHVPALAGQPVEQTVHRMAAMLSEADKQEALRSRLHEESQRETEKARHAEPEVEEAERELLRLREEAHCADVAGLEEALRRWKEWRDATASVEDIEQRLVEAGGGASVAQLESEAREVDIDGLRGRVESIQGEIDELDRQRTGVMARRADARAELDRMDGSARVAVAAEDAQEVLARLRRDVERFVELRLARTILEREIERYRGEHQAPLLVRARELFEELTLGAYTGLHSHFEEDERPQLVATQPGGRTVGVGEMSSGTRDQLFLALRLATLEEYLERSEPMPFIVDDILVNFDDERARATLQVLADLGTRTQVLLFTHHGRVREHAEALGDRASVQQLGEG